MRSTSAIAVWVLVALGPVFAAEQPTARPFDSVPAPEIKLQPTNLETKTPTPGAEQSPGAQNASEPVPEYWKEMQPGLDKELDKSAAGNAPGSGGTPGSQPASTGTAERSTGAALLQALLATCVVIALILGLYYLLSRYGKKTPLLAGAGLGRILGRVHLSPKAELYFVRVKDRVLVVGVTANEVSRVAEFDAALFETAQSAANAASVETAPAAQTSAFAQELRALAMPEPSASAVSDELAALKAELEKARQFFRETTGEPGPL